MDEKDKFDSIIINEIQLILAEKRTTLAVMRTGIAVLVLPISVLSVLIATSRYYDLLQVLYFLIPLGTVSIGLIFLGVFLIGRSIVRMRFYDRIMHEMKLKHSLLREFIE